MLKHFVSRLLTAVLVSALALTGSAAQAATKKSQTITWSKVTQVAITDAPALMQAKASSKLPVKVTNLSPIVCKVTVTSLTALRTGTCKFTLTQAGNTKYKPAPKITASVLVFDHDKIALSLPTAVTLGDPAITLNAVSKSGNSVALKTSGASCQLAANLLAFVAAGTCTITASTQTANGYLAETLTQTIAVLLARTSIDRPDTIDGWQVHAIYVQPADATDRKVDVNGYLAAALDEGTSYLGKQIGLTLPIDQAAGGYDIGYLKSSYTTAQIMALSPTQIPAMMTELKPLDNPSGNRKNYVFFIDVPMLNNDYCGWADRPGFAAVVAIGKSQPGAAFTCTGAGHGFDDYVTKTWVHEVFHNLGVEHNSELCDLMYAGSGQCAGNYTIDAQRHLYVGASVGGADITTERVWTGYTSNNAMRADCFVHMEEYPRTDSTPYVYCPTGTIAVGTTFCYNSVRSADLQKLVNGTWVSVGTAYRSNIPWGASVDFDCTNPAYPDGFWVEVTTTQPGVVRYRWLFNGSSQPNETFDVIYAR